MTTKAALKSIRAKLKDGEPEGALHEATQLLRSIGEKDPEAPNVLSFRALALTYLERIDEATKSYQTALKISPGHNLASAGLKKLFIKYEKWDELGLLLETAVQEAYDERDAEKVVANLQELLDLRLEHGPKEKLLNTLSLLLPSSPLVPLIQSTTAPPGSYIPLAAPVYPAAAGSSVADIPRPLPHVFHLAGSLPLTLYLLLQAQNEVHTSTEARVKAGRQRIGARSERDVRRQVDGDILPGPWGVRMINLLRDVSAHPNVDEAVRRDVEVQEFNYWRRLVAVIPENGKGKATPKPTPAAASLPPKPKAGGMMISASLPPKPSTEPVEDPATPELFKNPVAQKLTKADARDRANSLADGFVLLGVGGPAEEAWNWVIEGKDEPTVAGYDLGLLHKFAHTFPSSSFTDFIDDYCRLHKLPLPEPEEEQSPEPVSDKPPSDEKVKYRRPKKGKGNHINARARRKARRVAKRDGDLAEDISEEEREELVASMTKLLERLGKSIFAQRVMARVAIKEEDWANAIAYAEKGRKLVREVESERGIKLPNVQTSLDEALAVALVPYYPPKHHERADRLLKGVLKATPGDYEARFALGQIKQAANDWEGARAEFQTLLDHGGDEGQIVAAREEFGWCLVNEGKLSEGREVLEEVVEVRETRKEQEGKDDEASQRARAWWRLGRTEWMIGDDESRTHAEEWFMASLRADAAFAPSYSALGICYAEAHSPPDTDRALKCFQKAFELDATEADAARRLAIGYADDDEWALVRAIATRVMEGEGGVEGVAAGQVATAGRFAPKNGWAWKALGSTEMHYKNYPKAIAAYQVALRADPEDASMWRLLGDAYVKSGRHMAGLKALQHALEIDPEMWMAEYHIGEVQVQLGAYAAAIESFQKVDDATDGKQVGVTAALAEATLALGTQAAAGGFRERSRRAFHQAITFAAKVLLTQRSHRAWGWKLIGDAALQLAEHEVELEDIEATAAILHPVLEHLVADDEDRRSAVTGFGHVSNLLQAAPGPHFTIQAAIFAFAYRAHLLKNEHVAERALYDLACALHFFATITLDETVKSSATKAAISAVRLALERDATEERLWNALGVICASAGPQLAQHAFVVSLECYSKDPVVWTNLGYLYLGIDDRELANQCFLKAQTMDPDYARAWFGQAVLAQRDGQHHDANGLFAHAFTLSAGSLLEADLALALGAYQSFLSPYAKDTTALQQPAFALQHYIHSRPRDALAKHLYALVCERLGLVDNAVDALESAITLLEEEFETTESAEVEANYAVALVNLGRVRLAAGRYDTALEAFTNAEELVTASSEPRVSSLLVQTRLGLALSQYWLQNIDASLDAFQRALEAAKNDVAMTDELAVLLARTLWAVGDEDAREAAKTQLMECLEHEEPSAKVVAALGAVGLGSADSDLIDAAVSELKSSPDDRRAFQDPSGWGDMVLFANAIVAGDEEAALSVLEAAAVSNPTAGPRNRLAAAYVQAGKTGVALTLLNGHRDRSVTEAAAADRTRGIAATLEGEETTALQRAVVLQPWDEKNWEALAWARRAAVEVDTEAVEEAS